MLFLVCMGITLGEFIIIALILYSLMPPRHTHSWVITYVKHEPLEWDSEDSDLLETIMSTTVRLQCSSCSDWKFAHAPKVLEHPFITDAGLIDWEGN